MERVAVVGPGGAGKSTFARRLGALTGLPVVHLDRLFWRPGWVESPRDEWTAVQQQLVSADHWILDGNYGGTMDVRFAAADTVIVVQPPRWLCVRRALWRTTRAHGRAVQADGCPERFDQAFIRWIWRYPVDARVRLDATLARHPHLTVVELRSRREIDAFLMSHRTATFP